MQRFPFLFKILIICGITMNDILKPELTWIEGRCYRVNGATVEVTALQEHDLYENEIAYGYVDSEEDDFEVNMIDSSRYSMHFHVSKHYIGSIIGKKGAIKSRIERDTKTEIKVPRQGQAGDIFIYGPSANNVKTARRRINIIVMSSRMKQKATHFISIPMSHPDIINNFNKFKERVLREIPSTSLEESLFIKPQKLHLTLGMMCLMDNEERLLASKLLTEAKDKIIMPLLQKHIPLRIRLKGLSYMNDDPKEIDVLYGLVEEEGDSVGVLQKIADALVEHFYKAGFMDKEHGRENVKLHVTIMNSKYRSRSSSTKNDDTNRSRPQRETFDGSLILEKFSDYNFGATDLTDIHLSQRHSMGPDAYYQPTCIISVSEFNYLFVNK